MQDAPGIKSLHPREIELRALEAMAAEIRDAGSGIPPLIKSGSAPDAKFSDALPRSSCTTCRRRSQ